MVTADTARTIVGIIGNVISCGLFLSPLPTFWRIWKKRSVEEFKPDPYLATVLNCMMWVWYGMPFVHPDSLLVITINGGGLVVELMYLAVFFTFTDKKGRLKVLIWLLIELIFMGVIISITALVLHGTKNRSMFVGIVCVFFNVLMYFSPLTVMKKVIKTKSVEYMPFYLSLANFLNGLCWTAYGLIKFDVYIVTSNGLGVLSGAVQLIIYAIYRKSTPKDRKKQSELQLPVSHNQPSDADKV